MHPELSIAVQVETPLELAPRLSDRLGNNIYMKREDMQPVFSFKVLNTLLATSMRTDVHGGRPACCTRGLAARFSSLMTDDATTSHAAEGSL